MLLVQPQHLGVLGEPLVNLGRVFPLGAGFLGDVEGVFHRGVQFGLRLRDQHQPVFQAGPLVRRGDGTVQGDGRRTNPHVLLCKRCHRRSQRGAGGVLLLHGMVGALQVRSDLVSRLTAGRTGLLHGAGESPDARNQIQRQRAQICGHIPSPKKQNPPDGGSLGVAVALLRRSGAGVA